jgi:regulator of replication initiation timing
MSDRVADLENRVARIEDALIELRIHVGQLVGEMKMLRIVLVALGGAIIGVDLTGMVV